MGSSKGRDQDIYFLRTNPGVSLWFAGWYRSGRLLHLSHFILAPSWSSVMALSIGSRSRSILNGTHTVPYSTRIRSRDNRRPQVGRWCGCLPLANRRALKHRMASYTQVAYLRYYGANATSNLSDLP